VLSENGIRSPSAEVFDFGNRRFLELERFDRTAVGGRIPTVSLQSFDAAFLGIGPSSWSTLGTSMEQSNFLPSAQAQHLSLIWRFGQLIGNTDMHLGNISFLLNPKTPLTLAPVYDMLPMIYRPGLEGQIPDRQQLPESSPLQEREAVMARDFWERVARAPSISTSFQEIAASHAQDA
jgi:serine/threonine protein kinase HipA of HipAB toxin-antitoxin module